MNTYLLDTNIVSLLLRRHVPAEQKLEAILALNAIIVLSPVVFYEVYRGLFKRDSKNQMAFLEQLFPKFIWANLIQEDWHRAAQLWAERERLGKPISDTDLLIAVQAERLDTILVTDNEKDFDGLGVRVENWKR